MSLDALSTEATTGVISNAEALADAEARLGRRFPADFREFFAANGPGSLIDTPETYVELWSMTDVVSVNELPEVRALFPDLIRFGGNGSREALAFDFRTEPPRVVLVDITGSTDADLIEQGPTFTEFLSNAMQRGLYFGI